MSRNSATMETRCKQVLATLVTIVICTFALLPVSLAIVPRHPDTGIYAIWYPGLNYPADYDYYSGGQAMAQWKDVEPTEGNYDFSRLDDDLQAMHAKGMKATVQVNANHHPAWMFKKVPYLPKNTPGYTYHQGHGWVDDEEGILMFWHDNYRAAHVAMLEALANHLRESPYKSAVLGIRQNHNAVGTEAVTIFDRHAAIDLWVAPPRITQGPQYTRSVSNQYLVFITDKYG